LCKIALKYDFQDSSGCHGTESYKRTDNGWLYENAAQMPTLKANAVRHIHKANRWKKK
jgi:hypothetical protein